MDIFLLFKNACLKQSDITLHLSPLTHLFFKTDKFIFQLVIIQFSLQKLFIKYYDIVSNNLW